jgi:hypothetical protein
MAAGSAASERDRADTNFLGVSVEEAIKSPPTPGAFEVVPQLVTDFEGKVWIISKCGEIHC